MNNFNLVGRVAQACQKSETEDGLKICRIKIRTDKPTKNDDDLSNLFEITVFRSLAEENYEVDDHLAISGKLVANNFEKDDNTYYNAKLVGNSITILNN